MEKSTQLFVKVVSALLGFLLVLNVAPALGMWDKCASEPVFQGFLIDRPACVIAQVILTFGDLQPINSQSNVEAENNGDYSNPVNHVNQQTTISGNVAFNQAIFDSIQGQGEKTTYAYNTCVNLIRDYGNKINSVRDQSTLYIYDGDVKNCINEYLIQARLFAHLLYENPEQVTQESHKKIQTHMTQQINNLKILSLNYKSLSAQRHSYIHGQYQVNSLIQLGELIGHATTSISAGDPIETINSIESLYAWWDQNGGRIDTGWG